MSSKYKNVKYFLCITDVFTKHERVKPLKPKKGETILNAFVKIVIESNHNPNKLWVDQGREYYKKLVQKWLDSNDISMYSARNQDKSVFAKIYKRITANDSTPYLPYLNKLVDQFNNTYHHSINKNNY